MGLMRILKRDFKEFHRDNIKPLFLRRKGFPVLLNYMPNARMLINWDNMPPKLRPQKLRIILLQ